MSRRGIRAVAATAAVIAIAAAGAAVVFGFADGGDRPADTVAGLPDGAF